MCFSVKQAYYKNLLLLIFKRKNLLCKSNSRYNTRNNNNANSKSLKSSITVAKQKCVNKGTQLCIQLAINLILFIYSKTMCMANFWFYCF